MSEAIDANVLLYASDEESPRQPGAQRQLERLASGPDLVYVFWPVRELARRAAASAPASENERFAAWLHRIAGGCRAADMMRPDASDDITDPYGGSASEHATMVEQVASAVDDIVRHGPWAPPR